MIKFWSSSVQCLCTTYLLLLCSLSLGLTSPTVLTVSKPEEEQVGKVLVTKPQIREEELGVG